MQARLRWLIVCCPLLVLDCARRAPETEPVEIASAGASSRTVAGDAEIKDVMVAKPRSLSDVSFSYNGPSDDGSVSPDAACASSMVPAQPVPLDMYIVLDRSASMQQPLKVIPTCTVGEAEDCRWCHAIDALGGFFAAPTSNGMGVALDFVPHGNCSWISATEQDCCAIGDCCGGSSEALPEVALGELPGHFPRLIAALDAQDPLGTTTPLEAALRGMTQYMKTSARAGRQMVGLITTDGRPNGCERDTSLLADLLLRHRESTGQLTFVLGMTGANYPVLEQLARAGGAMAHSNHCAGGFDECTFYDVGDGDPKAFIDALQQIQRSVVACHFGMPKATTGLVDPNTLVVQWSSDTQPNAQPLPHVDVPTASCQGWYADPENTGEFALCATTCALMQTQPSVQIDVLIGCRGS